MNHTKGKMRRRTALIALAFLLPFLILYTIFTIWPVIQGFYVSLHKWGLMGKQDFLGFANYAKLLTDNNFWGALRNTLVFTVIATPLLVVTALVLALFANRPNRIKRGLRILYYLPSVLSVSVASFIAKFVFSPYTGLLNGILHAIGVLPAGQEIQWLNNPVLAMITVSVMTVWWTVGFSKVTPIIVFLQGRKNKVLITLIDILGTATCFPVN